MHRTSSWSKAAVTTAVVAFATLMAATSAAAPAPTFPAEVTYSCTLKTKTAQPPNSTFYGTHYTSVSQQKTRIQWMMHFPDTPAPQPFMLIGDYNAKTMTTVGPMSTTCSVQTDYDRPLFETKWAENATYEGLAWMEGQLCHKWSGVVPFVIQGVQDVLDFYADYFTGMPVAYDGPTETLLYTEIISTDVPDKSLFVLGADANCTSGGL